VEIGGLIVTTRMCKTRLEELLFKVIYSESVRDMKVIFYLTKIPFTYTGDLGLHAGLVRLCSSPNLLTP
jgi:hypothetical protein